MHPWRSSPDFTPGKTSGCSPLAVSFMNIQHGASAGATYIWNFGNGNGISTTTEIPRLPPPILQVRTIPFPYRQGRRTNRYKNSVITVYKSPVIDFSITNTLGCLPLTPVLLDCESRRRNGNRLFLGFRNGKTMNTSGPRFPILICSLAPIQSALR